MKFEKKESKIKLQTNEMTSTKSEQQKEENSRSRK